MDSEESSAHEVLEVAGVELFFELGQTGRGGAGDVEVAGVVGGALSRWLGQGEGGGRELLLAACLVRPDAGSPDLTAAVAAGAGQPTPVTGPSRDGLPWRYRWPSCESAAAVARAKPSGLSSMMLCPQSGMETTATPAAVSASVPGSGPSASGSR